MQLLVVTEARNGYGVGDIIAVKPDSHRWGRRESIDRWVEDGGDPAEFPSPWFSIVRVPGEPADLNLADARLGLDPFEDGATIQMAKRAWRVDIDRLPGRVRNQIGDPGVTVEITRSQVRNAVRRHDGGSMPLRVESDGELVDRSTQSLERERLRLPGR